LYQTKKQSGQQEDYLCRMNVLDAM